MFKLSVIQLIDPNKANLPQSPANESTLQTILSDFFITLGAVAVLMVVIAGLRYTFARGNPEKITQAKNMIIYSVIGLVIASLAFSIVSVVLNRAG